MPLLAATLALSCGLFEPRDAEDPTQPGLTRRPPTEPQIVIANLQSAISERNLSNYMSCFADPATSPRVFTFQPSPDASAQYGSVLENWTRSDEEGYFQNLIAKTPANASSDLALRETGRVITADSVIYTFDYRLTFEHGDPGFPTQASGSLQFALTTDNTTFWSVYRWSDFKTSSDPTWSLFKGRFGN